MSGPSALPRPIPSPLLHRPLLGRPVGHRPVRVGQAPGLDDGVQVGDESFQVQRGGQDSVGTGRFGLGRVEGGRIGRDQEEPRSV